MADRELYGYSDSFSAVRSDGYTQSISVSLKITSSSSYIYDGTALEFRLKVKGWTDFVSGGNLRSAAEASVTPIDRRGNGAGGTFSISDLYNSIDGTTYTYRWRKSSGCAGFHVTISFSNGGDGTWTMPSDVELDITDINFPLSEPSCAWTLPNNLIAGQEAKISWNATEPDGETITAKRLSRWYMPPSSNTGTSSTIAGSVQANGSFTDRIPSSYANGTVWYSLEYSVYYGDYSSSSSRKTVIVNSAPSTPGIPVYPSTIGGGSEIEVSWGESTDDDGNLAGYILEFSSDGGNTWENVYQGKETKAVHTVLFGLESASYRVKAYDTYSLESSYAVGKTVTVTNNSAPQTPSFIIVPMEAVGGGKLTVTWNEVSDPDGDAVSYELDRTHDGTTDWERIYSGDKTSYTDTLGKDWADVTYRVRASDALEAKSYYVISPTRSITSNSAPYITCSYADGSDLGVKEAGFSISYSVSDADSGDTLTVTERVDGAVKRTFKAIKGASNSFLLTGEYFMKILNGSHLLEIEASDGKTSAFRRLSFVKSVKNAEITLKEPLVSDKKISICVISVAGSIPDDAEYRIEITNNAKDAAPVWEDCTGESKEGRNHVFANESAANGYAFNFRVSAFRVSASEGTSGKGGYITSIQGGFQ